MGNWDGLYNAYLNAEEQSRRHTFNSFMDTTVRLWAGDLDKLYAAGDMEDYQKSVSNIKKRGFRVFRTAEGKHKVVL